MVDAPSIPAILAVLEHLPVDSTSWIAIVKQLHRSDSPHFSDTEWAEIAHLPRAGETLSPLAITFWSGVLGGQHVHEVLGALRAILREQDRRERMRFHDMQLYAWAAERNRQAQARWQREREERERQEPSVLQKKQRNTGGAPRITRKSINELYARLSQIIRTHAQKNRGERISQTSALQLLDLSFQQWRGRASRVYELASPDITTWEKFLDYVLSTTT